MSTGRGLGWKPKQLICYFGFSDTASVLVQETSALARLSMSLTAKQLHDQLWKIPIHSLSSYRLHCSPHDCTQNEKCRFLFAFVVLLAVCVYDLFLLFSCCLQLQFYIFLLWISTIIRSLCTGFAVRAIQWCQSPAPGTTPAGLRFGSQTVMEKAWNVLTLDTSLATSIVNLFVGKICFSVYLLWAGRPKAKIKSEWIWRIAN